MNGLAKIFGFDSEDYDQWQVNWAPEDPWLIAISLGLMVPLALWFFWTSLRRVGSKPKKVFLFFLRVVTFVLLLVILLRPELEFKKSHSLKNHIAILLDNSKSLSIKTFPKEVPRIDLVRKTLESNKEYFDQLKKDFQVDTYFVSDGIEKVSSRLKDYQANRPYTDYRRVLEELNKIYENKSLQGVFLFSDGADLTQEPGEISPDILKSLTRINGPVHTLQAGSNDQFRDLALESVSAPDFGFVQQPVRLSLTVFSSELGNRNVPLVLKEGDRILVSKIIEIREDQKEYKVDLQFTPRKIGKRIYTLNLPRFAEESILTNNQKEFEVDVARDRIRILHLNGRPSWDSRYLREVLANNPRVDLLSFFILRNMGDDVVAPTSELSLIPFPSNLLFDDYLSSFDLIIFQNFKYEPFIDKKYLSNIRKYVEKGGAFLMVGGELSFQGGSYSHTPIEDILPVSFKDVETRFIDKEFRPKISGDFSNHPILRLEKEFNEEVWSSLPPLHGANLGLVANKDAYVLLKNESESPILVAGEFGEGRTALLATDSVWSWGFGGAGGRYFHRFWNNVIDWLIAEPETRRLQLESDKERYREEEQVLIKFKLLKENYQPAENITGKLTLSSRSGEVIAKELKTDKLGGQVFPFIPEQSGFYEAVIEIEGLQEKIMFSVLKDNAEFEKPLVNDFVLKKIAQVSGGQYKVLDGTNDLSALQFENPEIKVKSHSRSFSLWENWWAYGLVVGFLVMDWWLRRKAGLS
ncbi:glutamine amidotransferase [Nitrospinaceae bacterium]|nr:glutamine amidotransferase [Nitrospinaceae bacterium]